MQYLGWSMLAAFFVFLYVVTAQVEGYWMATKIWLGAIAGTAFVCIAMFLVKGGAL